VSPNQTVQIIQVIDNIDLSGEEDGGRGHHGFSHRIAPGDGRQRRDEEERQGVHVDGYFWVQLW